MIVTSGNYCALVIKNWKTNSNKNEEKIENWTIKKALIA